MANSNRASSSRLAVLLPVSGTVLTQHMAFLMNSQDSTNLLAVVVVGILGGLPPSMVTVGDNIGGADVSFSWSLRITVFLPSIEALHLVLLIAAALVVLVHQPDWRHSEKRQLEQYVMFLCPLLGSVRYCSNCSSECHRLRLSEPDHQRRGNQEHEMQRLIEGRKTEIRSDQEIDAPRSSTTAIVTMDGGRPPRIPTITTASRLVELGIPCGKAMCWVSGVANTGRSTGKHVR